MKKLLLTIGSIFLLCSMISFPVNAEEFLKKYVPEYDSETGELLVDREPDENNIENIPGLKKMSKVIYVPESEISIVEKDNSFCNKKNRSATQQLDIYNDTYGYEYFGTMDKGNMLQALYSDIDNVVKNFHVSTTQNATDLIVAVIDYSKYELTVDEAVSVWNVYRFDNPLYYWLDYMVGISGEQIVLYTTEEYDTAAERISCNEIVYSSIDEYVEKLPENASDYTKVLAFHDIIIEKINYAYENLWNPETELWAHNIMGVFEEKGAVCEGYTKAFQLLLNYIGVENIFVTGQANGGDHAWNLIKLDDNWYWIDLTWDDKNCDGSYGALWQWPARYDYFGVTDTIFLESHTVNSSQSSGEKFLYQLPNRALNEYTSSEILINETFTFDNTTYRRASYNGVELNQTEKTGDGIVPETVVWEGNNYEVISIEHLSTNATTIYLPKTIKFVWDFALGGREVQEIVVDVNNPYFTAKEGVLFTKSFYTLIQYPLGKTDIFYQIPNETHLIACQAFGDGRRLNLKEVVIGDNVEIFGIVNWGNGYQDKEPTGTFGGNLIIGELIRIFLAVKENGGTINVSVNNTNFIKENNVIYSSGKTGLWVILDSTITSFQIPKETRYIDMDTVFKDCTPDLCEITVEDGNKSFAAYDRILYDYNLKNIISVPMDISGHVTIAPNITRIEKRTFWYRRKLQSIELSNNIVEIGEAAFNYCTNLENIMFDGELDVIGENAFAGCEKLNNIDNILKGISIIPQYAFYNCKSLKNIVISDGVKEIGEHAFSFCTNLENIVFNGELDVIGDSAFYICEKLNNIDNILKGISIIPRYAFYNCESLKNIVISDGVKEIGEHAFSECSGLIGELVLPDGLTCIEKYAFLNCYNIDKVIINDDNCNIYDDKSTLPQATIVGHAGSTAHSYAQKYQREFVCIEHDWEESVTIDKEATCTLTGLQSIHCKGCGIKKDEEVIPATGHSYGEWITDKEASCTEVGSKHRECSNCGGKETENIEVNPTTGHSYGEWITDKKASCTENGSKYRECSNCDSKETESIEATGHTEVTDNAVSATCEKAGLTGGSHCSVCNEVLKVQKTVEALGHNFGDWRIVKAVTCTREGYYVRDCSRCQDIRVKIVEELGHIEVTDKAVKATCISEGKTEGKHCSRCNEILVKQRIVEMVDHAYIERSVEAIATCVKNGIKKYICTGCGKTETEIIEKLGHKYSISYTVDKKATTTASGSKSKHCTRSGCKAKKSVTTIYKASGVKLSTTTYTYNGKTKSPTVYIKDSKGNTISSSNYTLTKPSGRKNVGKYTYKIKFKNAYSGSKSLTLTINPKGTSVSKVTATKKAFTVKWKKQLEKMATSRITGYQIQYSTSKKFTSAKTVTVSGYSTTSKKISKLSAKKTYYVRVRTYKTVKVNGKSTKLYSGWSTATSVKTK